MNVARTLPALAVAAVIAGCGGTSDSQQITSAMKTYLNGIANRNGQQACSELTSAAAKGLLTSANQQDPKLKAKTCGDVLNTIGGLLTTSDKQKLRTAKIVNVKVKGNSANASVQGGAHPAVLVKTNGHWLINGGVGS
jgi:hypothetical protein